jgi:hypothetical protein
LYKYGKLEKEIKEGIEQLGLSPIQVKFSEKNKY